MKLHGLLLYLRMICGRSSRPRCRWLVPAAPLGPDRL